MFDKYLNKEVSILVSTDSGAGISNGGVALGTIYNSMFTVVGTLSNFDSNFIEIKDSKMTYYDGVSNSFVSVFSSNKSNKPNVLESESTLLNLSKVISISLVL
jgi:hypothetical protein